MDMVAGMLTHSGCSGNITPFLNSPCTFLTISYGGWKGKGWQSTGPYSGPRPMAYITHQLEAASESFLTQDLEKLNQSVHGVLELLRCTSKG